MGSSIFLGLRVLVSKPMVTPLAVAPHPHACLVSVEHFEKRFPPFGPWAMGPWASGPATELWGTCAGTRDPGPRARDLGFGNLRRFLGLGHGTLGAGHWGTSTGTWAMGSGAQKPGGGPGTLGDMTESFKIIRGSGALSPGPWAYVELEFKQVFSWRGCGHLARAP